MKYLQASEEEEIIEGTSFAPAIGGSFGVILVVIAVAVIIIYRRLVYVSLCSLSKCKARIQLIIVHTVNECEFSEFSVNSDCAKLEHPLQSVAFVKKAKNK